MNFRRFLLGVLLGGVLLYLFFRHIDLPAVWQIMKSGSPYWLALSVVVNISNYFVRSLRWRYFFMPRKKIGVWNSYYTTVIGFAVSAVFPARVGEIVRPYMLGNKEGISKSSAFATIVVERIFDSMMILFVLVFYLLFLIEPQTLSAEARSSIGSLKEAGLAVFAGVVVLVLFLYYLKTKPAVVMRLVKKLDRFLPGRLAHSIEGMLESFIEGLSILHDPLILLKIAFGSLVLWMVICVGFWAAVRAYVPGFHFTGIFLILILLAIGVSVPTPAAVGSYHLACQIGLSRFFAVPTSEARAIAIVSHFISFVPVIILGILFIWREGLTARQITSMVGDAKSGDSSPVETN